MIRRNSVEKLNNAATSKGSKGKLSFEKLMALPKVKPVDTKALSSMSVQPKDKSDITTPKFIPAHSYEPKLTR